MAVPNRSKQIEVVSGYLEKLLVDDDEESFLTVDDVAKRIVDGIYDMWTRDVNSAPFPLVVGKAFKLPLVAKVYHVAWIGRTWRHGAMEDVVWVVTADSDYGTLAPYDSDVWRLALPSNAKAGAPGASADGWKVGDRVSHSQGAFKYEIQAVGVRTNLLQRLGAYDVQAESSSNLEKYYRREEK